MTILILQVQMVICFGYNDKALIMRIETISNQGLTNARNFYQPRVYLDGVIYLPVVFTL